MNVPAETAPATETTAPPATGATTDAPTPDKPLSLAEHASQFGARTVEKSGKADTVEATEAAADVKADDLKPIRPVDRQKREQGRFTEGRQPIKASEAVARINQLTGRAKTAEERLARAEAELAHLRAERATPAQIAKAEQKVERAEAQVDDDPEPREDDPKYGGDYGKYLTDSTRWAVRDENRKLQKLAEERQRAAHVDREHRKTMSAWATRVEASKTKHQDFEAVAFAPTRIPAGSAIDAYIMEDDNGPELLYYLNHPNQAQELGELLTLPTIQQVNRLALLSQRLSPSSSGSAGSTGSAATRQVVLPPRPPNPVRTEAQRASEGPPTDRPLSLAEHSKYFGPRSR